MSKALEGIRVIDLSHVLAAPTCTMFLASVFRKPRVKSMPRLPCWGSTRMTF
jgi:hypothetical protein